MSKVEGQMAFDFCIENQKEPLMILHEKIAAQLPAWRERIKTLAKEHADVVVDKVTVGQIVGGITFWFRHAAFCASPATEG